MNKADLRRQGTAYRKEIGLELYDALDPYRLADQWGIDVYQLSDLDCSAAATEHFTTLRTSVLSGMLVPVDTGAVILENDSHESLRRRSTMGHEMAHVALGHTFASGLVDERGCRLSSPENEREAAELGGELLLPAEAAKWLAYRGDSDREVATKFQVSEDIARWRLNATGARRFAERAHARRRNIG